jgi:predicted metal-dependent hydrolase
MPELPGSPPVEITLRHSPRARRFSLRVSRLDGRVTLSVPRGAPVSDALAFARQQEGWIRRALSALPAKAVVAHGTRLPIEGRQLMLVPSSGRLVRVEGESLLVPGDAARAGIRAMSFLKVLARSRLIEASDRYAAALGVNYTRLRLRDARSRWGSCTADRTLMYSWRLAMAPVEVLDYVAAHEVAHLVEMNHAPAFWAIVSRLVPDYSLHRDWLRRHGQELHGYDVTGGD